MQKQEEKEKKIAVVGIGGVGGYLAGMLGQVCPHLTLTARGKRKEALQKNGVILHSDYNGELVAKPEKVVETQELEEQDYIFICVKNYSLEKVCEELKHAVTENTVIIPVMNGVDPGERIRKYLGKGTVVDSLIYIVAFSNADASITQQGKFARVCLGIKNASDAQWEKVEKVAEIFDAANIDHQATREIEVEIWRKYILNCAYNVTTAYYDNAVGELRKDKQKSREYEALVQEAYQVALAKGVGVKQEHIDAIIHRFYYEYADNATSSLQRDIHAKKKAEVESFSGYIVKEAKKYGLPVPISEKMYQELKSRNL